MHCLVKNNLQNSLNVSLENTGAVAESRKLQSTDNGYIWSNMSVGSSLLSVVCHLLGNMNISVSNLLQCKNSMYFFFSIL